MEDFIRERYELALERIEEIRQEPFGEKNYEDFFHGCADYICGMCRLYGQIGEGCLQKDGLDTLQERNGALYREVLPEQYKHSYLNPAYAAEKLGADMGRILCVAYAQFRAMIGAAYEQDPEELVIYMELFLEIYHRFADTWAEETRLPQAEEIRQIFYWFVSDYADVATEKMIRAHTDPGQRFALDIVMNSDLTDLRYLYAYGEYVSENELRTARHMNALPEEKIRLMADTYTEGYRIGFEMTGKDLGKKKTVAVYYRLGFERMIRQAVKNFEKLGLKTVIFRPALSLLQDKELDRAGFTGSNPNKQFDYDHKDDQALVLDRAYVNRRLDVLRAAYEAQRETAAQMGGPALVEAFGEAPFVPETKPQACALSEKQQALDVEFTDAAFRIKQQYIRPEERSFTIIAFPIPEIGDRFEEIFDEIIKINTLDYMLYRDIQQKLIDALDQARYVTVKGMNGNRTDLKVAMFEMRDPASETIFENCVADVNIPVGEVFTSPRLAGTNGVLHVSRVFLNELEYRDLSLTFRDGMITAYSCANFASEEENRKLIKENILFHHETLPMGEFAIGTNTTAYVAAKKYNIEAILPILIAEKMGPHFAVGDTCYSHEEDLTTYNPDGKRIVARYNEVSAKRGMEGAKAYFNCHTDITIPYDELGELAAVKEDGSSVTLIREGRFVLPGCEALNNPFKNVKK